MPRPDRYVGPYSAAMSRTTSSAASSLPNSAQAGRGDEAPARADHRRQLVLSDASSEAASELSSDASSELSSDSSSEAPPASPLV